MNKVVLCPNPYRDTDFKVTMSLKEHLNSRGVETAVSPLFEGDRQDEWNEGFVPLHEAAAGADMLVCFGGDGTILHSAKYAMKNNIPILGVNMGSKGFMAELETDELELTDKVLSGEYGLDQRMVLDICVVRDNKVIYEDTALNETVVSGMARIIDVSIYGDGRKISHLSGDGVIISTPTGSTAYSMSAGGPIVEPTAENIIITPLCAHALAAKAFVLAPDREVAVKLESIGIKTAFLSVDGVNSLELHSGDIVKASKSAYVVELIRVKDRNFYDIVSEKLGGEH